MKRKEDIEYRLKKLKQTIADNKAFLNSDEDIALQEEEDIYEDNYQLMQRIKMLEWVLN
jgi:hypothetical protein